MYGRSSITRFIDLDIIFSRKARVIGIFQNTLLIFIALTLWLIGSLVVIQIDMEEHMKIQSISFEYKLKSQLKLIDAVCQSVEKKQIRKLEPLVSASEVAAAMDALKLARREKIVRDNLIFIPSLNQMWCLVPKAASTTWSSVLLDHLHIQTTTGGDEKDKNDKSNQVFLKEKFGYSNKRTFQNAVTDETVHKILLVRHPFARIASAYENKLKDRTNRPDTLYFFQNYGSLIYRKYGRDRRMKDREPTFLEFVDYLIKTDPLDFDEHWAPISLLCGLCHIRYDFVIKTEELHLSAKSIQRKLGLTRKYDTSPKQMNSGTGNEKIMQYFQKISSPKKVLLYKKYEMDFRLFNYSLDEYT